MSTLDGRNGVDVADGDEAFFVGAGGVRPNEILMLDEEAARRLESLTASPGKPTPALVEAFAQRRRSQAKSRYAG